MYIQNVFEVVDQIGWSELNIITDSYGHTVSNGHFNNGNRKSQLVMQEAATSSSSISPPPIKHQYYKLMPHIHPP